MSIEAVLSNEQQWHVEVGDVREVCQKMPAGVVRCVCTSPPYWGLRDYGLPPSVWGGDPICEHEWGEKQRPGNYNWAEKIKADGQLDRGHQKKANATRSQFCVKCGAWLGCLGLEPTPELFIAHLVDVFREVRRVMRPDATLWINIGDTFSGSWGNYGGGARGAGKQRLIKHGSQVHNPAWDGLEDYRPPASFKHPTIKPKDLVGIPWMLAFAMRTDGWWLRSEVIWSKPNCMTESVTDRPTRAHEHVFLFTPSAQYFYDSFASREACASGPSDIKKMLEGKPRIGGKYKHLEDSKSKASAATNIGQKRSVGSPDGRNMRSVWRIASEPLRDEHFAAYPTALVRRPLIAGTSSQGCCSQCGAPIRRLLEKNRRPTRPGEKSKLNREDKNSPMHRSRDPQHEREADGKDRTDGLKHGNRDPERHITEMVSVGWEPTCNCEAAPIPCLVMDPFNGSGTTGLVAKYLGLRYVGIELNPDYAEMAVRRIRRGIVEDIERQPESMDSQNPLFE